MTRTCALLLPILILISGCDDSPIPPAPGTAPTTTPVSVQMAQAAPELQQQPYRSLLQFEQKIDAVFVSCDHLHPDLSDIRAHSGHSSLRLTGELGTLSVKLASLLNEQQFPGGWTIAGAYFYSELPAQVTASIVRDGKTLSTHTTAIASGTWTLAPAECGGIPADPANVPQLQFKIASAAPVWIDDVMVADNTQQIVGDPSSDEWSIERKGFSYLCTASGKFSVSLKTAETEPGGWAVEESSQVRVRFISPEKKKHCTIYADGRSYWDGDFKPLASQLAEQPLLAQQQQSPATLQIAEPLGRLDRRSPGDANNDGYNETRGSYMIVAAGPRLEVTIVPRSVPVYRPVLEISKLPPGKALVTVEGQLINDTTRLDDGRLLVEIPAKLERPTLVTIHVQ